MKFKCYDNDDNDNNKKTTKKAKMTKHKNNYNNNNSNNNNNEKKKMKKNICLVYTYAISVTSFITCCTYTLVITWDIDTFICWTTWRG